MNNVKKISQKVRYSRKRVILKKLFIAVLLIFIVGLFEQDIQGQEEAKKVSDEKLLQEYIQSKGNDIIVFDNLNIKQFWIDKSVIARDNFIELKNQWKGNQFSSIPLKIQLNNVLETQDCTIEVLTETPGMSFSVSNSNNKRISNSSAKTDFLNLHVVSGTVHLEDTDDFSFNLVFSSKREYITIKKIILSFSHNLKSSFFGSPGFKKLAMRFEKEGITVPNTDVQYIIDEQYNKMYLKIPKKFENYTIMYHVYPKEKKDLQEGSKTFNNNDFNTKAKGVVIPTPYLTTEDFIIICHNMPTYEYSRFRTGQYDKEKRYWTLEIKK